MKSYFQSQMVVCRQFVRGDCVEGGAVVHKERPDVGVFIFQVGEGIVEIHRAPTYKNEQ